MERECGGGDKTVQDDGKGERNEKWEGMMRGRGEKRE